MRSMVFVLLMLTAAGAGAQSTDEVCPAVPRVPREASFDPGGLILTAFDRSGLWVVDIDARVRYPLDDTRLCGTNCRLSPDATTVSYLDGDEEIYRRMTLDGIYRETLYADTANDVVYWSPDTLLIYTAGKRAYLRNAAGSLVEIDVSSVISIQPGGLWALALDYRDGVFVRQLVNIALKDAPDSPRIDVGPEARYFNAAAWSPDGRWVAAVVPVTAGGATGGELVVASPDTRESNQVTDLLSTVGPLRIGGVGTGGVSWSPDSRYVAFWGAPLTGDDVEADVEPASLYVYDHQTGGTRRYCGVTIEDTTPEPPRLIWSPDGTHVAFAGNPPDDARGSLLLAVDVETGVFTELTEGMSNLLGRPNILAWGLRP
jgi:hypothetical protein